MPQPPAINQRVQTRVYKHKSCRRFLQDYKKYFFRLHACHSKFSEYLWQIANQMYKVLDDKNISQHHSDNASDVPQLPAVNQRVQTGVDKQKR